MTSVTSIAEEWMNATSTVTIAILSEILAIEC